MSRDELESKFWKCWDCNWCGYRHSCGQCPTDCSNIEVRAANEGQFNDRENPRIEALVDPDDVKEVIQDEW